MYSILSDNVGGTTGGCWLREINILVTLRYSQLTTRLMISETATASRAQVCRSIKSIDTLKSLNVTNQETLQKLIQALS